MVGMKRKPAVVLPTYGITKYFRPSEESNVSSSDKKGDTDWDWNDTDNRAVWHRQQNLYTVNDGEAQFQAKSHA